MDSPSIKKINGEYHTVLLSQDGSCQNEMSTDTCRGAIRDQVPAG